MFGGYAASPDDYEIPAVASSPLTTPTPDGSGETTHPCVVFIPGGWRGYRYWMAVTPYPAADSEQENPCILRSNDGDTWAAPTGLTNPIDPWPGGSDYNSDTELVLDPSGETLHCFWRAVEFSATPQRGVIYVSSSRDGAVWSTPVEAITNATATARVVSPTVWWDPAGGEWVMVGVSILPSPNVLVRYTSPTPAGPWVQSSNPTVTGALPSGRDFWHINAKQVGDVVFAVMNDTLLDADGSGGGLYMMRSSDQGQSWELAAEAIINRWGGTWDQSLYRSSFVPLPNGDLDLWYAGISSGNAWRTGRCRVTQKQHRNRYENEVVAAAHGASPWVLGDRFRRSDGTSGLGTLDSGESWTAASGTWGISSNQAYLTAATNGRVTVDSGLADLYMEAQFTVFGPSGQSMWLNFRYTDSSNFWRFGADFGTMKFQKVVSGSVTELLTTTHIAAGDRFCVWCNGNDIWVGVNGQRRALVTDSAHASATVVGLQTNNTTPRFRNFMVRELVNGA